MSSSSESPNGQVFFLKIVLGWRHALSTFSYAVRLGWAVAGAGCPGHTPAAEKHSTPHATLVFRLIIPVPDT